MHPYISQTLATEHMMDAQRKASAARLASEASHAHERATRRHAPRRGVAERAAWQRLVRGA